MIRTSKIVFPGSRFHFNQLLQYTKERHILSQCTCIFCQAIKADDKERNIKRTPDGLRAQCVPGTSQTPTEDHGVTANTLSSIAHGLPVLGHATLANSIRKESEETTKVIQGITVHCNDNLNLRQLNELADATIQHCKAGDPMEAEQTNNHWATLVDCRAELFLSGWLKVDVAEYGIYRTTHGSQLRYSPTRSRRVVARDLIDTIESSWDVEFTKANQAEVSDLRRDSTVTSDRKLTCACHPLAISLRRLMVGALSGLDGSTMEAGRMEKVLHDAFTTSTLFWTLHRQQGEGVYPHGFFIYQSQLVEIVLRRFVGTNATSDGMIFPASLHPSEWKRRLPFEQR